MKDFLLGAVLVGGIASTFTGIVVYDKMDSRRVKICDYNEEVLRQGGEGSLENKLSDAECAGRLLIKREKDGLINNFSVGVLKDDFTVSTTEDQNTITVFFNRKRLIYQYPDSEEGPTFHLNPKK